MGEFSLIEKLVLDEINGKNQAIHAYDRMIWVVRSGFLTLFFAGWGILLKSLLERPAGDMGTLSNSIIIVMMLVSVVLGMGGLLIDKNYAKRKFRVIYALDGLMTVVVQRRALIQGEAGDIEQFLQVSGDKKDKNYKQVSGYRHEAAVSLIIYLLPMIIAIIGVVLLWK